MHVRKLSFQVTPVHSPNQSRQPHTNIGTTISQQRQKYWMAQQTQGCSSLLWLPRQIKTSLQSGWKPFLKTGKIQNLTHSKRQAHLGGPQPYVFCSNLHITMKCLHTSLHHRNKPQRSYSKHQLVSHTTTICKTLQIFTHPSF